MESITKVHRVSMKAIPASKIVREVYHRGVFVGDSQPASRPFLFPASLMTKDIEGRVEVAEFSPHFAYAYTDEWRG